MRKQIAKRLLAGLMCISLVFQGSSVTLFAAEPVQEETMETTEKTALEQYDEKTLEKSTTENLQTEETEITEIAENVKAENSTTEEPSTTEVSGETEGSGTMEEPGTIEEPSTTEGSSETDEPCTMEEPDTIEEPSTETEETNSTDENVVPGEFHDVSVEFDGYHAILNAGYTLSSNAKEATFYLVLYDQDNKEIISKSVYASKDKNSSIYSISEQTINLYDTVRSVRIKSVEYDDSGSEIEIPILSEVYSREQIPEIHFTAGEPEVITGSITVSYYFDGNMCRSEEKEDGDFSFEAQLKYGVKSVDENSFETYEKPFKGEDKEKFSITVYGLEAATTYHAQLLITIPGFDSELGNIYEQTIELPDFTTPTDETYDLEQAFPDEVFREMIRESLSLDTSETTVKESQLGKITNLYGSRNDITEPAIKDIKGIELLYNVTDIELNGHEITDVSNIEWDKLSELTYLCLQGNCIETLPDLTKNTYLKCLYISDNYIPSAEILGIQDKLPKECQCWDYGQRQKEFKLIMEEKYYQTNGKSEVVLRIQGYNGWFAPTFKTYIDGNPIKLEANSYTDNDGYNYLILYNTDIPYELGTYTFKFEMYQDSLEEPSVSKEVSFEIAEQKTFIIDPQNGSRRVDAYYMSAQEEYLSIYTYSAKKVSEFYLVKDGVIYGKNDYLNSNGENRYFNKYPNLGSFGSDSFYYRTSAGICTNKRQLLAGSYDLKLVYEDGTEELLEETVEVVDAAIIKSVNAGGSYDNTGEYLYLALTADYLDPSQISYTIRDNNTYKTLQTEYIDCKPIYNGYVVKLKKIGWGSSIKDIRVYFSGKGDYPLYVSTSDTYCYIENLMYFCNYNYQSNMLEIGIPSQTNISDYTYSIVRTDLAWDFSTEHIQEEYTVRLEDVEDTIYNVIPQWEGEDCTLYGGYYRFSILRSDDPYPLRTYDFYISGRVIERSKRLTDNGFWGDPDYNLISQQTGRVTRQYFSDILYTDGNEEDFSAQITGELLESPLDAQSLHTWNHSSDTNKTGIGMEFDFSTLEIGDYTIELYYRNSLLSTYEIKVIPNNIFVLYDNLYVTWESEDTFYMSFYTPNCEDSDDYTISLTDINGNKVEGLTITNLSKYTPYVNMYVSGLKKSEADRWYYIKILHKTKGDAYCKDLTTQYYNGYGKYTRINSNTRYGWHYLNVNGVTHGHTGIWQNDTTIFPATLTIYQFNDTESLYSTVLNEDDFNGDNYYFMQDLIDSLPRAEGYYDIVLIGNSGQFLCDQGVQIALNTDILNEFRVEPSSMTLKLDDAEESSKTIIAFNSAETPVFESDDTTIADVTVSEDDPNVATVKAVGVGKTSITVTSGKNIQKVTVVVKEKPVDAETIQFNTENVTVIQGMAFTATVKVEPENAWLSSSRISYTSSDETIVSVGDSTTRNVTLTANNLGTATITAKLEGTTLAAQCTVTVIAGFTEEDKAELISKVGDLYFLEGAEHTLADIKLPEGWRWSNPSQKPTADSERPAKEFTAVYTKDGLDYFSAPLSVFVTSVSTKITGVTDMQLSTTETYKLAYKFIGYKPDDNTTYAVSYKWVGNDNLKILGKNDQEEVSVRSGTIPGSYVLQGTIYIKNTKSGEEFIDTLSLTVAVKDYADEIVDAVKKKTYYFLSGADTCLNDIPIDDKWSWVRPDTVPQVDESIQIQNFAAQYTAEDRQPINARLSVAVSSLDKVNISGAAKIATERTGSYRLKYQFSGYDITDTNGYDISYQWKGSGGITIDGADNDDMVTIKTGSISGRYTLTAEVTVTNRQTGNTTKAEGIYQIQVLDKDSIDNIIIRPAEQQPEKALTCVASNGVLESDYAALDKKNSFCIQLAADTIASGVVKDIPVQWASSDTKVADIDHTGLVTVKGSGITVISAASTDNGGYSEEIVLKIQDFTPAMDHKSITVFQYGSMGTEIGITEQNNNKIQSIAVNVPGLKAVKNAGVWYLQASGYSGKTVENVILTISTNKGEYEKPLKVTINVTQPNATLKQSVKPNIFYSDAEAVYKVTSKYTIERIEDASGASEVCFHVKDYDVQAGLLTLEPYGIAKNIESYKAKNSEALKARIKITFEGYAEPVEMTVKVSVQNKKPSFRIDTAAFIKDSGMDEALTVVRDGKTLYHLGNAVVHSKTENVSASVVEGKLRLNYSGSSNTTYRVDIQDDNWTQAMTVSGKIQMINADALGLQAEMTKITVNKANLSTVVIPVAIKGNSALEPDISIDYPDSAMTAVYRHGAVEINVLESAPDKTYKIVVGGTLKAAGRTYEIHKAVIKVTVTSKEASVKLFASGKINIADRKYSSTIYTPTLNNMDANIIDAEVTGDMSEYFYAYLDEMGKVVLKAVSGKPLKANVKYVVDIATSFDNGYRAVTKVNIKPVNKFPKVKASPSKGTLYKASADSRLGIKLTLDARYSISQVKLVENPNSEYFTLTYDQKGLIIIALSENGVKIPSGTYAVSYQILIADADNEKPIIQEAKITIK